VLADNPASPPTPTPFPFLLPTDSMPRFFIDLPLVPTDSLTLPPQVARHVQVLRLQPGETLTLFNGRGGEWAAEVAAMGRQSVTVRVLAHDPVERELPIPVTLVAAMPANDRFDWLVEKATELGVAAIEPVQCERSVLRLSAERAERKAAHWQGVAIAAAEQCGRTRVPRIALPRPLREHQTTGPHSSSHDSHGVQALLLSLGDALPLATRLQALAASPPAHWCIYSGPEGGYTPVEEAGLRALGAMPTRLGERVLRAETAPLATLAVLAAWM
jgi:16S rRNA (uracil1498-N3)-methyltransferase